MRIKLHLDTIQGESVIRPFYEINFDGLSQISGFNDRYSGTLNDGSKYDYFYVSNSAGLIDANVSANIPRIMSDNNNNCVFPYRLRYDDELGGVKYPHTWLDDGAFEQLAEQPTDWNNISSCKYLVYTEMSNTPAYRGFAAAIPTVTTFRPNETYIDHKRTYIRRYVADNGAYFVCSQMCIYGGYAAGSAYYYPFETVIGKSQGNDTVFHFHNKNNATVTGDIAIYNSHDKNTQSPPWSVGYNDVYVFVHFVRNSLDYYGIARLVYSSFDDNAIITHIECTGFTTEFWGTSIIPGGGGSGSWGSNTETGGGDGTWTYGSDTRGDGSGAVATAIADEARQAMDAFFTGANGFKLHQLLPADIPDIYGTLYSTSFIQRYQNVMYSPLSSVLSVHMIPHKLLDLAHATTPSDLTLSGYNISTQVTQKQYPQIPTAYSYHVGKIDIDATDTFLDYAPYTNAYLHLPYIGVLTLDINAIAAGSLAIDYITDAITGNCTALVWCSDREGHAQPKYVAQGNCSYSMPMFSAQQDGSALGRIASSALGLTMSVATGNLAGAAAGIGSVAAGMFDAATAKQNTQVTGSFGGNAGMISDTMIWLEIVRPQWCNPQHYQLINGIPSQLSGTIAAFNDYGDGYTGYLRITDIDTDGIQATDAEIRQIDQLLRAGIFVNPDT